MHKIRCVTRAVMSDVNYSIYYYDYNNLPISMKEKLQDSYNNNLLTTIKYRIYGRLNRLTRINCRKESVFLHDSLIKQSKVNTVIIFIENNNIFNVGLINETIFINKIILGIKIIAINIKYEQFSGSANTIIFKSIEAYCYDNNINFNDYIIYDTIE